MPRMPFASSKLTRTVPTALTEEFAEDPGKSTQWNAFLLRNRLDVGGMDLAQIIQEIRPFLIKPMAAAAEGQEFEETWPAKGPWIAERQVAARLWSAYSRHTMSPPLQGYPREKDDTSPIQ